MPFGDVGIPTLDFSRLLRSISLRSRTPPARSVGSAQLADQSVITRTIAFGAVTPGRAAPMLRRHMWLGDETLVSGTATGSAYPGTRKDFKFVRSGTAGVLYGSLGIIYELRRPPGSAGSVRMRVFLGQGSPGFQSPYVNSGSFALRSGSFRVSQLAAGSPIQGFLKLRTSATTASAQNRLLELYGVMSASD